MRTKYMIAVSQLSINDVEKAREIQKKLIAAGVAVSGDVSDLGIAFFDPTPLGEMEFTPTGNKTDPSHRVAMASNGIFVYSRLWWDDDDYHPYG